MTRAIITTAGKIELRMMTQIGVCGTGDTKRERERGRERERERERERGRERE